MYKFHRRCGDRVTLLNHNLTAVRNFVEFNHGLILSADPLTDDVTFEVRIDRKVNVWNGSLEIGVTTLDPEFMELPATATKLRNTAWILSGNSIVKDGVTTVNSYGPELDTLREGDTIGVTKTSKGELMFFINGRCLGLAAKDLPQRLFAVIDLYGQCVQVSIIQGHYSRPDGYDVIQDYSEQETAPGEAAASTSMDPRDGTVSYLPMPISCPLVSQDHLRFHPRCGILVKLTANNKTAERARPLDDYNNGVVMTHRPLYDNELFEIRIDRLVDKWSGSIEVGVTSHNPATIRFPSTMTNMDTGTIMMSGCKVLLNGHGTCMEYGNFNLDELREGDTVGMMRKSNGKLHYFINGIDQGVATDKVPQQVWGVIDLYGMTVKVTIVDPCEDLDSNIHHMPIRMLSAPEIPTTSCYRPAMDEEMLLFHTLRDSNVIIINDGKTAHRPNAFEFFNNGVVMTNRTLKTNELFQVRLDLVIPKWAGSIEIGVTTHSANDIKFPFKMSNAKSGTWAVTGEDVIRDGTVIIPQYVRNLNRLVEGDTVGVMRKDLGILHFFVNGVDQGPAGFNIPEHVFGIVDLYGRVAQATIVDAYMPPPLYSPESPVSTESNATVFPDMCFHRVHGRNARLSRNRLTASRATVYSEFNDAVLFSSRPLRECDMFELRIDKMIDCWIGSLEIGVTAIRPEDLEVTGGVGAIAGTATDLSWDTYILSGAAMMKDGECVRSGYPLDLDTLTVGSRVGMMWHADRSLHYYLDGMDMGKAWYVPHLNIYAVVDLYGQCTQVTIMQNEERAFNYNGCNSDHTIMANPRVVTPPLPYCRSGNLSPPVSNIANNLLYEERPAEEPRPDYNRRYTKLTRSTGSKRPCSRCASSTGNRPSFSEYIGENVSLSKDHTTARRVTSDPMGGIVFSSTHLVPGEIFEIKIMESKHGYAGSFRIGVTDVNILNANVNRHLPLSVSWLPHYTSYVDGRYLKSTKPGAEKHDIHSFVPSFEWLRPGDRIGLKKTTDSRVIIYYNSEPLELGFENVPDKVYAIMDMFGHISKIQTVSRGTTVNPVNQQTIPNDTSPKQVATTPNIPTEDPATIVNEEELNNTATEPTAPLVPTESVGSIPNTPPNLEVNDEESKPTEEATDVIDNDAVVINPEIDEPIKSIVEIETTPRYRALPYTFHYLHGANIKLCSSDTVAMRVKGHSEGIAIASQPLRRGHYFRLRVDKLNKEWQGTVSIGAVAVLPNDPLPWSALHIDLPCWIISNDVLYTYGKYMHSEIGRSLEDITENSVLTLHFCFNSELSLEMDGEVLGTIGVIPRKFTHIYPVVDLYGRIVQVSILLHPHILHGGNSLDLPLIEEHQSEDTDVDNDPDEATPDSIGEGPPSSQMIYEMRMKRKCKAHSQANLIEEELEANYPRPGPSTIPDQIPPGLPKDNDVRNKQIKHMRVCPNKLSLHQSLILSNDFLILDNDEAAKVFGIQKSQSTQNFGQQQDDEENEDDDSRNSLINALSLGSRIGEDDDSLEMQEDLCDTNIRHNDRFPEANDVDNLDNEIMDALTLETGNLPDLSEEQSPSIDESTRRDDFWADGLSIENLNYLNGIICWDPEATGPRFAEREWVFYSETNGNCEHMHLALKYWNHFVLPYPDMREVVASGQVRCYCTNCQPDAEPPFAGWVRIERANANGTCHQFWHVLRSTVMSAQAVLADNGTPRRPRSLGPTPSMAPACADVWFDEEGKPHHAVLALDIDVSGPDAENDRLLAYMIYLRSHVTFQEPDPLSFED